MTGTSAANPVVHFLPLSEYDWSISNFGVLPWNPTVYCLIASLFAVALWLSIELSIQVWFLFKRYTAVYFWMILITTFGIAGHTIAFILKLFVLREHGVGTTFLAKVSWVANTTGFSLVLYSRLDLVLQNSRIPSYVLAAIIVDAILFHTPVVVFAFGLSTSSEAHWVPYMDIAERIQIVGFTIQEFVISSIYTYSVAKWLKSSYSAQLWHVLILLIVAQVVVFGSDLTMVVVDCANMFILKAAMHPFIYAVKLKIEFVVLNQLRKLVKHGIAPRDLEAFRDSYDSSGSVSPRRKTGLRASSGSLNLSPDKPTAGEEIFSSKYIEAPGLGIRTISSHSRLASSASSDPATVVVDEIHNAKAFGGAADSMDDIEIEKMDRLYLGNYRIP